MLHTVLTLTETLNRAANRMDERVQRYAAKTETILELRSEALKRQDWTLYAELAPYLIRAHKRERIAVLAYQRLSVAWIESWQNPT